MRLRSIQILGIVSVFALVGCNHAYVSEEITVTDMSASVTPDASASMWKLVDSMIGSLHRGDSLVVLPITSDAGNDISGWAVRVTAPDIRHRQPMDEDLVDMRVRSAGEIEKLRRQFPSERVKNTDLLGTFKVISEKILSLPDGHHAVILILSDFVQDDTEYDFKSNPRLDSPDHARVFASEVADKIKCPLRGAPVFLGYLQSRDLALIGRRRRQAIETFWVTFLTRQGGRVRVATDGLGSAQSFLTEFSEEGK